MDELITTDISETSELTKTVAVATIGALIGIGVTLVALPAIEKYRERRWMKKPIVTVIDDEN